MSKRPFAVKPHVSSFTPIKFAMVCASITLFLVPFGGTSGPVFAEASPQFETPATSAHQLQPPGLSSDRDEPTIAQQFTAGSTNDNTTSPVGTTETQPSSNSNDNSADSEPPKLVDLVANYLKSTSLTNRAKQGRIIIKNSEGDIVKVARALEEAQVWDNSPTRVGDFSVILAPVGDDTVFFELPTSYDPARAYPLLVQMPSQASIVNGIRDSLWAQIFDDVIVVFPSRPIEGQFYKTPESAGEFRILMRAVRQRFHIDSTRVFLEGTGSSGNTAWMLTVNAPDQFAGVAALGAYLEVPFRKQLYPILVPNLGKLTFYNLWWSAHLPNSNEADKTIAACNQAIEEIDQKNNLGITSQEASRSDDSQTQILERYRKITTSSREPIPPKLSHYFRYPEQGQCAWLRQTKFAGDVWTAEQLSILPGPEVDSDQYITDVLKSLLAYMGGEIEGNTIRVETRRCADIELLLYENMVDFTKPVVVYINGKKRHDRIVKPSIPTLLEEAYDTFDFQRLVFAKLAFDIKEDSAAPPTK